MYCRAEYPLAIDRLLSSIETLKAEGILEKPLGPSGFQFTLRVKKGAGAFVCGEETALMASLKGRRGVPRPRPPYPSVSGLFGRPTVVNNVETLANVSHVMREGAQSLASSGAGASKGTKVFALTGKVKNTGLVEGPMGISLREIIYGIGGGIPGDKALKAVQIGGPSGGCIPAEHLDITVDYESLKTVGAMMGSGRTSARDFSCTGSTRRCVRAAPSAQRSARPRPSSGRNRTRTTWWMKNASAAARARTCAGLTR